ncbi:MAG: acyl-CoA carboxylase subunit beta [Bacteroidia bacterium]|jgi:acetyl-CoA carboxylase carboxyltransferase component|nr:acyl-CoA carboxylase subunit beta [Bacteroidia bacterium]GIV23477.1 MAG: methylcrotonoyl-CoA carboxylase [Bacteroidia bacterium]
MVQVEALEALRATARNGGGEKAHARQAAQGKWSARQRIDYLLDNPDEAIEIGLLAGHELYEEACPAGGVVVKVGKVQGIPCVIVANDATVKAGAWFPITAKKNLRAQEIAMQNRLPILYLVDSAGVYLPMQDEVFPDKEHFGRIFRNNAVMSAMGIPQYAAIMGPCVAGGAYLPIMSDEAIIVEKTGSVFLAGPYLVKAAIGEETDTETLGGARTHSQISGVTDYQARNDQEALDILKRLVAQTQRRSSFRWERQPARPPRIPPEKIPELLPPDPTRPYDMYAIIEALIDEGSFTEYKTGYGKTIITGYARIEGWPVGIVANQRTVVKSARGEMQFGGVIYSDSADKATRFILNCNQKQIPIVFLQDVTGFMVGTRAEHGGIIKDGAKMVNAVANSVVPKYTVVVGNSYGAGNYAMCGRAYDPRLMVAWPTARIAVMGGTQAAQTLLQTYKRGQKLAPEEEQALLKEIQSRYERQMNPLYAAARLWIDELILPHETRKYLSLMIEAAEWGYEPQPFPVGVIQT